MSETVVDLFAEPEPLYRQILSVVPENFPFSTKELTEDFFPNTEKWRLYRAVDSLVEKKEITFLKYSDRRKYYVKRGANELPIIKLSSGNVPCSWYLVNAERFYAITEVPVWSTLIVSKINKLPLLFSQLFVTAVNKDKDEWAAIRNELMEARKSLATLIDHIDTVVEHPSMSGDMDRLHAIFTGKDAPTAEERQAYMLFANRYIAAMKEDGRF